MSISLENSVILITGANRGIGRAILDGALERGARKIYAAVRRPESLHDLRQASDGRVVPLRLDLEDPKTIDEAAQQATDVQIVVHNAGIAEADTALSPAALENLQRHLQVNTFGLLRVAQAFAPILKANGGGALAQLNSVVSVKTFASVATYSASKAASYALTQALRDELAGQGTQVVSIHPGPIATDMARAAGFYEQAEPPSVVADALFEALDKGTFHVFPDSTARQIESAYASYAKAVVEADLAAPV